MLQIFSRCASLDSSRSGGKIPNICNFLSCMHSALKAIEGYLMHLRVHANMKETQQEELGDVPECG